MATMDTFQETEGKHISLHPDQINLFPLDSEIGFPDIYPLDSDFFFLRWIALSGFSTTGAGQF